MTWKKSLISNTDFSNLKNYSLEICLLEMVISNLISKTLGGFPGPPGCVWVCVCGGGEVGVGLKGGGLVGGIL